MPIDYRSSRLLKGKFATAVGLQRATCKAVRWATQAEKIASAKAIYNVSVNSTVNIHCSRRRHLRRSYSNHDATDLEDNNNIMSK